MKKTARLAMFLITMATMPNAYASEEFSKESALLTSTPVVSVICMANENGLPGGSLNRYDGLDCAAAYVLSSGTTTALLLLKDIQAAQPDALDYMAGAQASPLLIDVVKKLQGISIEDNGKQISFDDAVRDIVQNI